MCAEPRINGDITICLMGDVMLGRGIDQLFPLACPPVLHEPCARDAGEYVALAEARNGPISRAVPASYVWGDVLQEWDRIAPAARIVNLETSITTSNAYLRGKTIHYRMHPRNVDCLTSAHVDVCTLANNHVLDYDRAGLVETLQTLARAQIPVAGAGMDLAAAQTPAIIALPEGGRVLVYASGSEDSGVPCEWAADVERPGVDVLPDLSLDTARALARRVRRARRPGDVVVVSLHWGTNWGYEVPRSHVQFAHALVDEGVDIVYGHSSHHPRPIEIYKNRLILYGCGDFINDYEGIEGYEEFRGDLALLYTATLEPQSGALRQLRLTPLRVRRMRLARASLPDTLWLQDTMDCVSAPFGVRIALNDDSTLAASLKPT